VHHRTPQRALPQRVPRSHLWAEVQRRSHHHHRPPRRPPQLRR
jgi:hypothetical protein